MLVVAIDSEILLRSDLFIQFDHRLWDDIQEMKFHVECSSEGLEEVRYEFGSAVRSDMAWDTMLG